MVSRQKSSMAGTSSHKRIAGGCSCSFAHYRRNNFFFSSNEQEEWLPRTSSGELVGGMCMSEPGHGTDVLGLATRATRADDGSGDWLLSGQKMWITNGSIADGELGDVFLVYARTGGKDVPDSKAISLFLVPKGTDGFSLGQKIEDKCGMRASTTAALNFDGARVPAANLVGEEGGAVRCMMRNLEIERVTLAAMSLGIARRCVEVMNAYAAERQARSHQHLRRTETSFTWWPISSCFSFPLFFCSRRLACRSTTSARSSATWPSRTPSTWPRARTCTTRPGGSTSTPKRARGWTRTA